MVLTESAYTVHSCNVYVNSVAQGNCTVVVYIKKFNFERNLSDNIM